MRVKDYIANLNHHAALACLAIFLLAVTLRTETADADTSEINIRIVENSIGECTDLVDHLRTFILGMNQYRLSEPGKFVRNIFDVQCSDESISAEWRLVNKTNAPEITIASSSINKKEYRAMTSEAIAFLLVKQTMSKMPWDGEINALVNVRKSKVRFVKNTEAKSAYFFQGETSTGFASQTELGECVPLEVLRFDYGRKLARPMGFGLIIKAGTMTGKTEIVTKSTKAAKNGLFYRIIFGSSVPDWLEDSVEACKIAVGEDLKAGLRYEDNDFELSRDNIIELRSVGQKGGLLVGSLTSTNNIKVKTMVAGMINNHLEIGQWASVDMRALRSIYTSSYSTDNAALKASKPELTVGEFYSMLRFSRREWTVIGGPGLLLDKLNILYLTGKIDESDPENPTPSSTSRRSSFRAAGQFSLQYSWLESSLKYRYIRSWSEISPAISNELDFNYELTDTWSIGGGIYQLKLGKTIFDEPGARFISAYGNIGITLKQRPKK